MKYLKNISNEGALFCIFIDIDKDFGSDWCPRCVFSKCVIDWCESLVSGLYKCNF